MTALLVSGAASLTSGVAEALRARGADVTEVTDLAEMASACEAAGASAFDAYVQLPGEYQLEGATAIERVHSFYAKGVLARFRALAAALPAFAPQSRLVFVLGHLPPDVDTADDREARRALARVLAQAARADAPESRIDVRVLDAGTSAEDVSMVALGVDVARFELMARVSDTNYADWRVELLGLASVET
jgi:hypothetical protein